VRKHRKRPPEEERKIREQRYGIALICDGAETVQSSAASRRLPCYDRRVLTASIAAVILVVLYALNQRYLAMKCPHCGRVVSIHGKHKFVCDKCANITEQSLKH
jgi:hypothetical protein